MKIVLIGHSLRSGGGLVVGLNFVKVLKDAAPEHQYLVFAPPDVGYEQIILPVGSEFYFYRTKGNISRAWFDIVGLRRIVKRFAPSVIFGMSTYGVLRPHVPQAMYTQNANLVYPRNRYPREPLGSYIHLVLNRIRLRINLRYAQLMFCQTPVMRQRFCSAYKYPLDKTKVLSNVLSLFIGNDYNAETYIPDIIKERKPGDFYSLILSKYYAHKNPEIVLRMLRNMDPSKARNLKFITTVEAEDHPNAKVFLKRIREYGLENNIINVGRIPHKDLVSYYRNVDIIIMPTLLESFSASYLEAMHFGVPILTTDMDFARYICGNAAAYYEPQKEEGFLKALLDLKANPDVRKRLVEAGREQLKKFQHSWHDVVRSAINELEGLVRSSN